MADQVFPFTYSGQAPPLGFTLTATPLPPGNASAPLGPPGVQPTLTAVANATILGDGANDTKPYYEFYESAQLVTGLYCYPTMCFFGLTGNVFILIVMAQKSMSTSTNVFLSALAVSDIIKLLNDVLYFLTVLLLRMDPSVGNKCFGYLYPYAHFIFNMSVCVSSWLTVSVAVERYILVCHPTQSVSLTSIPRSKWISVVCFFVMTAVALPSLFRYTTVTIVSVENGVNVTELDVELTPLWQNATFVYAYNWLQSLLRSMLPLIVLIVTSTFIINALRKTRANKKMASRNKITIMLIVVIVFFLVCIIPDAVMSGFFNLGYAESDNYLVKGVREITDMLLGVNAAINFGLYMVFNKIFRDQFVAVFCAGRCHKWMEERRRRAGGGGGGRGGGDGEAQYRPLAETKSVTNGVNKHRKQDTTSI